MKDRAAGVFPLFERTGTPKGVELALILMLVCCLLGCADDERYSWSAADNHCTELAKERAREVDFEGEDGPTQKAVYNSTLKECTDWRLKFGTAP